MLVFSVAISPRSTETFNLSVDDKSTFFVVAGEISVLVHNQSIGDTIRSYAPVDIPSDAKVTGQVSGGSGWQLKGGSNHGIKYHHIQYKWRANGFTYLARFHGPQYPGAKSSTWGIQRKPYGRPGSWKFLQRNGSWVGHSTHANPATARLSHLKNIPSGARKIPVCP